MLGHCLRRWPNNKTILQLQVTPNSNVYWNNDDDDDDDDGNNAN